MIWGMLIGFGISSFSMILGLFIGAALSIGSRSDEESKSSTINLS